LAVYKSAGLTIQEKQSLPNTRMCSGTAIYPIEIWRKDSVTLITGIITHVYKDESYENTAISYADSACYDDINAACHCAGG
jgi:hypothetical protein